MASSADFALLQRYNKAVPRYTSYPTAPHFRHNFGAPDIEGLLRDQKPDALFSLYLHIPFCQKLCSYCGCFTRVVDHQAPIKAYVDALVAEIKLAGEAAGIKPLVSHIHFGGGSPNMLDEEDLSTIFSVIGEYFTVLEEAERAMEMDPRILSKDKIKAFAATGINRASLGVQDFQKDVQIAVNRLQPFEDVARSVDWMREAGITKINFDLMYGLPKQTISGIEDNITKTVALTPDRVALFGYAHVPWMRAHQKQLESYNLPGSRERLSQSEAARFALEANGYKAVGMDHFARPDDPLFKAFEARTLRRNFQGYTTDNADVLLGFGLSAISRFPQAYTQNTTSSKGYKAEIAAGSLPVIKGCWRSVEDRLRHDIIESLMCYFDADTEALCRRYQLSINYVDDSLESLADLEAEEVLNRTGGKIVVNKRGERLIRVVCSRFDAYFEESEKRHVKAV